MGGRRAANSDERADVQAGRRRDRHPCGVAPFGGFVAAVGAVNPFESVCGFAMMGGGARAEVDAVNPFRRPVVAPTGGALIINWNFDFRPFRFDGPDFCHAVFWLVP